MGGQQTGFASAKSVDLYSSSCSAVQFAANHSHSDEPLLTVIVPVFNEIRTIRELLDAILREPTPKDVLIVDDGSTDGTSQIVEEWFINYRVRRSIESLPRVMVFSHEGNRGKGAAIRTALEYADTEYMIVQDADLEVSPEEYPRLLEPLLSGQADFVIGNRTQAELRTRRYAFGAGVYMLNVLVRVLYRVSVEDEACCFKVLRVRDVKRMNLECKGFEFCPEIVAKAARLGLRFSQVPIAYFPRTAAEGKKLRMRDGIRAAATLWKYRRWNEHR